MLEQLNFVRGAISKKDFVPQLSHFEINDGTVTAYNGEIALHCKIPINFNCNPKATQIISAISKCKNEISITLLKNGNVSVKSGKFKATIVCLEKNPLNTQPEGSLFQIEGEAFLASVKLMRPFVGNDATRSWANGMLIRGRNLFATNNTCLVQSYLGKSAPINVNIPSSALDEIIRINKPIESMQVSKTSVTFHYGNDAWLRTQLLSVNEWPDLEPVLLAAKTLMPISADFFEGVETIKPFLDKLGYVHMKNGMICSGFDLENGATYEVANLREGAIFHYSNLILLNGVATSIDLSLYPNPCLFEGENLRGAIVGVVPR